MGRWGRKHTHDAGYQPCESRVLSQVPPQDQVPRGEAGKGNRGIYVGWKGSVGGGRWERRETFGMHKDSIIPPASIS